MLAGLDCLNRQWGFMQENKEFSLNLALNTILSFNATHSTVANNYVRIAINLMNDKRPIIVTENPGESRAYYIVIGF